MEGMGDRNFRFMKIKEKLDVPRSPEEFAYYNEVPEYFTRMNGVLNTLKGYKTTLWIPNLLRFVVQLVTIMLRILIVT